jgi:hypothetical protein
MTSIALRDGICVIQRMGSRVLLFASIHCHPTPATCVWGKSDLSPLCYSAMRGMASSVVTKGVEIVQVIAVARQIPLNVNRC